MKRATTIVGLMLTLSLAGACREEATTVTATSGETVALASATTLTPEELGELGAAIRKTPEKADELLAAKKLTRQTFEQAIRDLTEDPDSSKRYAEAYRKAGA
jgi:uncharacterized membrane protein YdfJ with MMPL/SSD domain